MKTQKMTVGDLMSTALITLRPDDTVGDADYEMKMGAFRHIPIIDERHKLVGIVSNRDILRALGKSSLDKQED